MNIFLEQVEEKELGRIIYDADYLSIPLIK